MRARSRQALKHVDDPSKGPTFNPRIYTDAPIGIAYGMTVGNSSQMSDGADAVLLAVKEMSMTSLARWVGASVACGSSRLQPARVRSNVVARQP